jgi:hypothetical protein
MNNYQLLMAFVSGMNNSALLRLKWTRAKVPKRALTTLKELEEMMSMEGSFKTYRAMLESSSPPCIPYVYTFLSQLCSVCAVCACRASGAKATDRRTDIHWLVLCAHTAGCTSRI